MLALFQVIPSVLYAAPILSAFPSPATATNMPLPYARCFHLHLEGIVVAVQFIPSVLYAATCGYVTVTVDPGDTFTNTQFPYTTGHKF